MPKTKRYRDAREIQQQKGGSYMDALRRADEEHERERPNQDDGSHRTTVASQWSEVRALTNHLRSILARLATGHVFVQAPPSFHDPLKLGTGPEARTLVVDDKWRMELIATSRLLAERIRVNPPDVRQEHLEFWWATPDNIEKNAFVRFARSVVAVADDVLKAIDS